MPMMINQYRDRLVTQGVSESEADDHIATFERWVRGSKDLKWNIVLTSNRQFNTEPVKRQ